jgi:DNA replication protein DnaC
MADPDLRARATALGLHGLAARWDELGQHPWVPELLGVEEVERQRRSLERRIKNARIGRFKPMTDFDWTWPRSIDREAVEDLFSLDFARSVTNVVLLGPNGSGKTMIAQNLAYQSVLAGFTVRFTTASAMLNDLAAQDGARAFQLAMRRYCNPHVLAVDEVGYLSYNNRHADLLFEVVTRRYGEKPIVVSTNKAFADWSEVFPNAACVVTLVDRLVHKSEILPIDAESYRLKEAREAAARRALARKKKPKP